MAEKLSIYAGPPMAAVLAGHDDQRSARINQVCADYTALIQAAMPELPRDEWCAIMDATNGLYMQPGDGQAYRFMWAEIADAEGLGEKWGIDQRALAAKVRAFAMPQIVAVAEASRAFWNRSDLPTDSALAMSGARIQG